MVARHMVCAPGVMPLARPIRGSGPQVAGRPFLFLDADRCRHSAANIALGLRGCQTDGAVHIVGKSVGGFAVALNIPTLAMWHNAILPGAQIRGAAIFYSGQDFAPVSRRRRISTWHSGILLIEPLAHQAALTLIGQKMATPFGRRGAKQAVRQTEMRLIRPPAWLVHLNLGQVDFRPQVVQMQKNDAMARSDRVLIVALAIVLATASAALWIRHDLSFDCSGHAETRDRVGTA